MRQEYPVKFLCEMMGANRSGYYKWRRRQGRLNRYEQDRELLTSLLQKAHNQHPSYGYHRLAAVVRNETSWLFSDNLAHKCCKWSGIRSILRRRKYINPGAEHNIYPNLVKGNWNARRPLELVVSDIYGIGVYEKGKVLDTKAMAEAYKMGISV